MLKNNGKPLKSNTKLKSNSSTLKKVPLKGGKVSIKRNRKQATQKRREVRKEYPAFFKRHIKRIKDNDIHCENCTDKLNEISLK